MSQVCARLLSIIFERKRVRKKKKRKIIGVLQVSTINPAQVI
jgi:hypothetical protein